jgi:hypothetical protein
VLTDALTVPSAAIQNGPDGPLAWVVAKGDVVQARPIRTGPTTDGRTMIEGRYRRRPCRRQRSLPASTELEGDGDLGRASRRQAGVDALNGRPRRVAWRLLVRLSDDRRLFVLRFVHHRRSDHAAASCWPREPAKRKGSRVAVAADLQPVAVVLDLVDPARSSRRFIRAGRNAGGNETGRHALGVAATPAPGQAGQMGRGRRAVSIKKKSPRKKEGFRAPRGWGGERGGPRGRLFNVRPRRWFRNAFTDP